MRLPGVFGRQKAKVGAAPKALPLVLDDVFDAGTGLQAIPVAHAFQGEGLRFACSAGACIDPVTGILDIPTDRAFAGRDITVTATNPNGQASLVINVAVETGDDLAATRRTQQLSVDGVTFHFETPAEVGHFISGAMGAGDAFVIGPVTLVGYSPLPRRLASGRRINGAMLNPACGQRTGFDSLADKRAYSADLDMSARLPVRLAPGDSVIVAISHPGAKKPKQIADHFVVLTCLADIPFADSFRPPYSGPDRPIHRWSDVQLDRLANLAIVGRPPDPRQISNDFGRFVLDLTPNWNRDHLATKAHPPLYGRDVCAAEGPAYVMANTNLPVAAKEDILIGLIQRGIDRYGIFQSGLTQGFHPWQPDGAHHAGRKFSMMFAGHLLGVDAMRNVVQASRGAGGSFQEDGMTFHVTPEIVDITNGPDWKPPYRKKKLPKQAYTKGMIGMPDWRGKARDTIVNAAWDGHPYRIAGNNNTQHGQVLAALVMGLQKAWGHDAYFDYHIRYTEIMSGREDPWRFRGGRQALYNPVSGSRPAKKWEPWQLYWRDPWAWQMLDRYRFDYYRLPFA